MPILKLSDDKKATKVAKALSNLPDSLDTGEVSALLLTITDAYMGEHNSAAISMLLTTTVVYARALGVPDDKIALFLQGTAEHLRNETTEVRMH
jgi:hypothetical protein